MPVQVVLFVGVFLHRLFVQSQAVVVEATVGKTDRLGESEVGGDPVQFGAAGVGLFIEVEAEVETFDRTGVEMEALTACAVAALTIYDMCKSRDRSMTIDEVALWEKTGGRSGVYRRATSDGDADGHGVVHDR